MTNYILPAYCILAVAYLVIQGCWFAWRARSARLFAEVTRLGGQIPDEDSHK